MELRHFYAKTMTSWGVKGGKNYLFLTIKIRRRCLLSFLSLLISLQFSIEGVSPKFSSGASLPPLSRLWNHEISNFLNNEFSILRVGSAESIDIPDSSVDLVTISQALHWVQVRGIYSQKNNAPSQKIVITFIFLVVLSEFNFILDHK